MKVLQLLGSQGFWQHQVLRGVGGQGSREYSALEGFPGGSDGKESACNAGDLGSIPGLGRSSGEGHGSPLQYSCLENPMDRGAWRAAVHGVAKSQTRLSNEAPYRRVWQPVLANTLQDSCLEEPPNREVWQTTVYRVTNNQTLLKQP